MKKELIIEKLNEVKAFSKWNKGVREYAIELVEELETIEATTTKELENLLLNGASNWKEYSFGGCSLIYDGDIAERLATPTELKMTDNGRKQPNKTESWLDVQARALYQAFRMLNDVIVFQPSNI